MKSGLRLFAGSPQKDDVLLYSISRLSAAIAARQVVTSTVTAACAYNAYCSLVSAPLFGVPWTGHAAFGVVGSLLALKLFVYESRSVSSMRLVGEGKKVEITTCGIFPETKRVDRREIATRWDGPKVYISASSGGFFLLNLVTPSKLSSRDLVTIPDTSLLKQVLGDDANQSPQD